MKTPSPAFVEFVDKCGTQQKAAEVLGVTVGFISQIMNGYSAVPAQRVLQWAELIGVTPADLRPDMAPRGEDAA